MVHSRPYSTVDAIVDPLMVGVATASIVAAPFTGGASLARWSLSC